MSKYKEGNFLQFPRGVFEKFHNAKTSTKWLYTILLELEHKFTGLKEDFFFRSIDDLSKDAKLSRPVIIRGLKELINLNLIQTWQMHWVDKDTDKKSEKHVTAIRILEISGAQ